MKREIIVIAHDVRSCHNVGSLMRTSEGLGVKKIYLTGYTPYPLSKDDSRLPHLASKIDKQIEKTALGAQKIIPWEYVPDVVKIIEKLKKDSYQICALEQAEESVLLNEYDFPGKIALILGNEVKGLAKKLLAKADVVAEIAMQGNKESFNVVQASAMALYALRFIP